MSKVLWEFKERETITSDSVAQGFMEVNPWGQTLRNK